MNAYKEAYLHDAAEALGSMMDYAVEACGVDGDLLLHMFVTCGLAGQFERGNPRVVAGMSGFDLAIQAIESVTGKAPKTEPENTADYRSPEFWAGWALAHYQWHSAKSFAAILRAFPFSKIVARYHPLHEADISKFYAIADSICSPAGSQTNLRRLREATGLSQSRLAEEAGVSLRSIQMYEQRNKDINKAQAITLAKLARVIGCDIEDLLESRTDHRADSTFR